MPQRKKADFRGTVSFASLNAHNNIVSQQSMLTWMYRTCQGEMICGACTLLYSISSTRSSSGESKRSTQWTKSKTSNKNVWATQKKSYGSSQKTFQRSKTSSITSKVLAIKTNQTMPSSENNSKAYTPETLRFLKFYLLMLPPTETNRKYTRTCMQHAECSRSTFSIHKLERQHSKYSLLLVNTVSPR